MPQCRRQRSPFTCREYSNFQDQQHPEEDKLEPGVFRRQDSLGIYVNKMFLQHSEAVPFGCKLYSSVLELRLQRECTVSSTSQRTLGLNSDSLVGDGSGRAIEGSYLNCSRYTRAFRPSFDCCINSALYQWLTHGTRQESSIL